MITRPGYEFAVTFYDIVAVGAVAVPLSTNLLPEEAIALLRKAHAVGFVVGPVHSGLASTIEHSGEISCRSVQIDLDYLHKHIRPSAITINENATLPPLNPAVILFSSGSTGFPKGVVHSRRYLWPHDMPMYEPGDRILIHGPFQWIANNTDMLDSLAVGACVLTFQFQGPRLMFERLLENDVTIFRTGPYLFNTMKNFLEQTISEQRYDTARAYRDAIQRIRLVGIGGGMLSPSVKQFWADLRRGRPLISRYNCTELGHFGMMIDLSTQDDLSQRLIGQPLPGVEVRIDETNGGECLIKRSSMFLGYLDDPERTQASVTPDGFVRTGDIIKMHETGYQIEGRANTDFIRYIFHNVSASEVEAAIQDLPYVAESYVLSVPDALAGHRVAALIRLKQDHFEDGVFNLEQLRKDLHPFMAVFKLPTILRVLESTDFSPLKLNGKPDYANALEFYFPTWGDEVSPSKDSKPNVETWDIAGKTNAHGPKRPWDGGGVA